MRIKNLSTLPSASIDIVDVIRSLQESNLMIFCIMIFPSTSKTGLLEERGVWIVDFWWKFLKKFPDISGCRFTWDSLFFCCPINQKKLLIQNVKDTLQEMDYGLLSSKSAVKEISGSFEEKMFKIDVLLHKLDSLYEAIPSVSLLEFLDDTEVSL